MSASIDTMLYVNQVPWHGLGVHYEEAPKSSRQIIESAKLGWTVAADPMYTEHHGKIAGYHTIYREDNNDVLGVVKQNRIQIVQNSDTFNAFNEMIDHSVDFETAASLSGGQTVFGCFKIRSDYTILDDSIEHYFVVMNDHLRPDGKVTVLNTPIRVVCQNTLAAALSNNNYKLRIPVTADVGINRDLMDKLLVSVDSAITDLRKKCEKMATQKISRESVETLLDELFPRVGNPDDPDSLFSKANQRVEMLRSTFITDCMGADNLGNFRGTAYQVFNALTDFSQHFFQNVDKGYDLDYRMKLLPGLASDTPAALVTKFLRMKDRLVA